jgi:hypothetical protein
MCEVARTDEFDEWFSELGEDAQAEMISKVELLKLFCPRLSRPHADTLNGSEARQYEGASRRYGRPGAAHRLCV